MCVCVCACVWTVCEALAPQKLQPLHLCLSTCVIGVPREKSCIHLLWQARPSSNPRISPLSRYALTLAYIDVHAGGRHVTCRSIKARQLVQLEPDRQAITGGTPSSATGQYLPSFYLHSCRRVQSPRVHESTLYHLRSKIKFVFPEMRKLGTTCGIARRVAVCLWLGLTYPHPNFISGTDIKSFCWRSHDAIKNHYFGSYTTFVAFPELS